MTRSPAELAFRLKQETANLWLLLSRPALDAEQPSPLAALPDPGPIVEALRGSAFAETVERLAGLVLQHRFPLLGFEEATGPEIRWRRDHRNDRESGTEYFRLVPYLDFSRAGDHKVVWELNRHQHLVLLAQAFRLTERREFVEEIRRQVDDWMAENPYLRGINWASALEAAFRALSWTWVHHLAGPALDREFRGRLLTGIYRHGLYIERNLSVYFSPNTHLLGEAVALHALGLLFPVFPPAARWRQRGAEIVSRQMQAQVREDGTHFEQSSYYQLYALDMLLFHRLLEGTTPEYDARLRKMAEYLGALTGASGLLPLVGDDDGGRFFHPYGERARFARSTLATCSQVLPDFGRPYREEDLHEQAIWWLGAHRIRKVVPQTERRAVSRLFSQGGVAVMADGDVQVIVDAGPFGGGSAGHSHADTLSVIARCGDEEVLVDAGTYTYAAGGSRDWFRGTSAHNTVRIDGREQGFAAGPFRWVSRPLVSLRQWLTSDEWDFLDAECGYADFVHRRRVFFLKPDLLLVLDELAGPPGEHTLEQFWHFGEPVACINPSLFRAGTGSYLAVPPGVGVDIGEGGEYGWRSPAYGVRVASPVLRVHRRGTLPATFRAVLDFRGSPEGGLSTGFDGVCTYRRGPRTWAFRYGQAGPPEWSCAATESGPSGFDLPESPC